jgi:hemolysin III
MKNESMNEITELSFAEEVGNSLSHGVMLFALLFSLPYYAIRAYLQGGALLAAGISIYFFCMIFMFGGSCLYHLMPYHTTYKLVFRKLDHIMILLAIAGTYTPICLYLIHNWMGYAVLIVEWVMAFAGIILKAFSKKRMKVLSLTIYLVMGWMAILILPTLLAKASWAFLGLILLGGLFYTVGIYFYNHPERNFSHFTWHIFINLASLSQMIAILYFM